MTSYIEIAHRVKKFLRFDKNELFTLSIAILVTAFIFSFRDWGETTFDAIFGLLNFMTMVVIAAISMFFRYSCQKMYALAVGYKAVFRIWWAGLLIAFLISIITIGHVPLVLVGGIVLSFMVKQRLGEFRYGFSQEENLWSNLWGLWGNLIAALLFGIGLLYFPESYFWYNGVLLNVIMAICGLIPLPQLDGLAIIFASRVWYGVAVVASLLTPFLLLSHRINLVPQKFGLITGIVLGVIGGAIYLLVQSEK